MVGFTDDFVCSVSPSRMFKAIALDSHNLTPKIMPQVVTGAGILKGDGGVGSIKQIKFSDVVPFGYFNERVDVIDKDNLAYSYTIIEGADVGTKLVSSVYHLKFVPSGNGGCVVKTTAEFTPAAGVAYTEADGNVHKEGVTGMYKCGGPPGAEPWCLCLKSWMGVPSTLFAGYSGVMAIGYRV